MAERRVGVWLVGATGNVATTATLGLLALNKSLAPKLGLVTELPALAGLDLVQWSSLVVGGHDIREPNLLATAQKLASERVLPAELVEACKDDLAAVTSRVAPGTTFCCGEVIDRLASADYTPDENSLAPRQVVSRLQNDLRDFAKSQAVDSVVVVNLASTEPPCNNQLPATWSEVEPLLDEAGGKRFRASTLYAIAALELGYPFVNFTPSMGSAPAAIDDLAQQKNVCHAGQDGKTGETLLKTVLAPMFAQRNLEVMSWVGHNIFGNLDGRVLDNPANRESKVRTKDQVLEATLGYPPQTLVSIEFIESLGDWKTAWDHVHFRGFLGTPMTMQLTWQGSDSALAAPLVLDLVRLVERSQRAGESGTLAHLASFFKSPLGGEFGKESHDFAQQMEKLFCWASARRTN